MLPMLTYYYAEPVMLFLRIRPIDIRLYAAYKER